MPDFSLRNLGFQIRYRYELAPLSNLYIAYVRGGFDSQDFSQDVGPLLGDSFSLHDSEQLLVKFELSLRAVIPLRASWIGKAQPQQTPARFDHGDMACSEADAMRQARCSGVAPSTTARRRV